MDGEDAVVAATHTLTLVVTATVVVHFEELFILAASPFRPAAFLLFFRDLCCTSCVHGVLPRRTEGTSRFPLQTYGRHSSSML